MKIATVIGARPQFIKAATISRVLKTKPDIKEVIIHTGQHYDKNMSKVFFSELHIPRPGYNLEVGSGPHGRQTGRMLEGLEHVLQEEKPDLVLTYGDTNSTLAAALATTKLHLPTAHVEAGLRSFNRQMPEEINRIVTDHISDFLFAPTKNAMNLLAQEGLKGKSYFSGDVMFDSILFYRTLAEQQQDNFKNIPQHLYYLASIHRPENTDDPKRLQNIFSALSELGETVILPLHPRTLGKLKGIRYGKNIQIISPIGYLNMVALAQKAEKIITDSGGLQKEAYFLQKPCITLRDQTEWTETIGNDWNFIVGADKKKILEKVDILPTGPQTKDFGDGHAAENIINTITKQSV